MNIPDIANVFNSALDTLCSTVGNFTCARPSKSLRNAELFFVFMLIVERSPDAFFESGFFKGRSTMIILESLRQIGRNIPYMVASLKRHREISLLKKMYPNLQVYYMPGEKVVEKLKHSRVGALVDGPKLSAHKKVFTIYNRLIKVNNAEFICQHDISTKSNMKKFLRFNKKVQSDFDCRIMSKAFGCRFKCLDNPAEDSSGNLGALVRK